MMALMLPFPPAALSIRVGSLVAPSAGAFPPDISPHGKGVDELFWLATALTGVAFVLVVAILVVAVVAFRARPGHRALHTHGDSRTAKTATGVFAAVVFVGLDVVLAVADHRVWERMYGDGKSPPAPDALVVHCLAKQFEWWFRYPGLDGRFDTGDDVRTQVLHLPAGRPATVQFRSIDVIHSFFLPNFRTKRDVLPGMTTTMVVHPLETGEFDIACAELCGMAHYRMKGRLVVETPEAFGAWMDAQRKEVQEFAGADLPGEESWSQYGKLSSKEGSAKGGPR